MFFFRRQNKQPPSLHVSTCLSSSTGRVTYVNIRKPNNNIPYFNQQSALIKVQSVHFQPSLIIIIFIYCNWVVKKILSTPSFGGEIKPSVPCPRFAACKRSINLRGSRNLGKITGKISRPQFHLSLLGSLASLRTYRYLAAKVGTSKGGGKQWQN